MVHNSGNVCSIYFDNVREGWQQWVLLSSDRHHDSVYCDRDLELQHLEEARERKALIIDAGDLYDVMQGKFDPRRSYDEMRPEYKDLNYLDVIVKDAAKFYGPYAKQFVVIGRGNHDQKVLENMGTDLISNTVHRLNTDHGGNIQAGGYGGWVRFMFTLNGTMKTSRLLKYFHGAGGGGPVTRGVIQTNRQAVYLPDADIVLNGHTHDSFVVPIARERISDKGVIYQDVVYYVRSTTYKQEYGDGSKGYHVQRWGPPKPLGATWLRFSYARHDIRTEIIPAVA